MQSTLTKWVGKLPDYKELARQRVSDSDILKMALEGKARLSRQKVRELHHKTARTGQFFTPEPIADLAAFLGEIRKGESVLDPACGLGDLMFAALQYTSNVEGIELMFETCRLASKVLGLNVRRGHSLEEVNKIKSYDVIVANPPFGRIGRGSLDTWSEFELNKNRGSNRMENLFLELCLKLAKRRVVMIVPNSLLSNPGEQYVRKWLLENFGYRATIDLPRKTFWKSARQRNKWTTPVTNTRTGLIVVDKVKPDGDYKIFMAIPQEPGDFEKIKECWTKFREENP